MLTPWQSAACTAALAVDDGEGRLVALLRAGGIGGTELSPLQEKEVGSLIDSLTSSGGSQRLAAEGVGSWGSWIGAWDVLYAKPRLAGGGPLTPRSTSSSIG